MLAPRTRLPEHPTSAEARALTPAKIEAERAMSSADAEQLARTVLRRSLSNLRVGDIITNPGVEIVTYSSNHR